MRLAIISDVHADVHALIDAIAQSKKLCCDRILCAGDIVDVGMFPQETIETLIEHKVPTILGNHDRWAIGRGRADAHEDLDVSPHDASGWDLSPRAIRYLAQLPSAFDATFRNVRLAVRHGSPRGDMDGIYPNEVTNEQARAWLNEVGGKVMFVGHTHIPFSITIEGGLIANPGALLCDQEHEEGDAQLFDPDRGIFVQAPARGGGTFGVLDIASMRFSVHRASDGVEIEIKRRTL